MSDYINALELRKITINYGAKTILDKLDLDVRFGEYLSILGENGAGKTTLFKGILQLVPINTGKISVLDKDVTKGKDKLWLRSQIGYVPQKTASGKFPISVFDAVLLGRWGSSFSYLKRPGKEDRKLAEEMLEIVNLINLSKQDCRTLSGGQSQRLNIARALVRQPKILLLDEPATHLDADSQETLDETIAYIRKQYALSIIMISHDSKHAFRVSDRVVCIRDGKASEIGGPVE